MFVADSDFSIKSIRRRTNRIYFLIDIKNEIELVCSRRGEIGKLMLSHLKTALCTALLPNLELSTSSFTELKDNVKINKQFDSKQSTLLRKNSNLSDKT